MARHDMTLRIFRILHYLETSRTGLRVGEIHERLEQDDFAVDKRTVHRDLELLQSAFIPLENEGSGPESRWKLSPFAELKQNIHFTFQEILSLYLGRRYLEHLKGSPFYSALDSLFIKLEKVLGTKSEVFQELLQTIQFRPQLSWHTKVPQIVLDTVYQALDEGHVLKISYRSETGHNAGQYAERRVGPECLYFANGGVYLIAKDLTKNEPRTYALSRIDSAEMESEQNYDREGLAPEKIFKESFGILNIGHVDDVSILVEGPIGAFVAERRWHETQTTLKNEKGITINMRVKINDELARWVLSLGPSATVLSPPTLAKDVERLALEIVGKYQRRAG